MLNLRIMLLAVVLGAVQAGKYLSEIPPYMTPCTTTDPNLNKCLTKNNQITFREWKNGIPGLKTLGPFDPLKVKRVKAKQHSGNTLSVQVDMRNITVIGAGGTIVQDVTLDLEKQISNQKLLIPKLTFDCDFRAKGKVLAFNIDGHGPARFESINQQLLVQVSFKLRHEFGHTFFDIQKVKVNIQQLDGLYLHVTNLLGGNKVLEETANQIFNENWQDIYPLVRPVVVETMSSLFFDRFKKMFAYVPAEYWVADIPKE